MPNLNPFWPKHSCLFKGFGDFVNMKGITNPIGNISDAFHDLGNGGNGILEAPARLVGLGQAIRPSNINRYVKAGMDPTGQAYGYPGLAGNDAEGHPIRTSQPMNALASTPTTQQRTTPVPQTGNKLPGAVIASIFGDVNNQDESRQQPIL